MIELFRENSQRLKAIDFFHKTKEKIRNIKFSTQRSVSIEKLQSRKVLQKRS